MAIEDLDLFAVWEHALRDRVAPVRLSETAERECLTTLASEMMASIAVSMRESRGDPVAVPILGVLSMWDLQALVGQDEEGRDHMGVGVGSVRLLDVLSAFLCSVLFGDPAGQSKAQERIGAFSYDWSRGLVERLRHWSIDPTLGLVRSYGLIDVRLGSIVPVGREYANEFYFEAMLTFFLAHELAHVAESEDDQEDVATVAGLEADHVQVRTRRRRHDREVDADLSALRVVFGKYVGLRSEALSAVSFLLGVMQASEDLRLTPQLSGADHPSPVDRLTRMMEVLPDLAPSLDENEVEGLRALAADLVSFAPRIVAPLLDDPGRFRASSPFIIEDYQDDIEEEGEAGSAAELSNAADAYAVDGDLQSALALYSRAVGVLDRASYGEGQRIVYANLISTSCALQLATQGVDWLVAGVDVAARHNDKPAVLYLVRVFDRASKDFPRSRDDASRRLAGLTSPEIQSWVERLLATGS